VTARKGTREPKPKPRAAKRVGLKAAAGAAPRTRETRAPKKSELVLTLTSLAKWDEWLAAHHATAAAVFLEIAKGKARAFSQADAVEVALAWGWIDSQGRALDDDAWLQRFGRRTRTSPWSKINRSRAEALIAAGKMQPAGLAEVERAKSDGRWERAYDGARSAAVPEDLARALAANARARAFFEQLDAANRYAILWRLQTAKKPETRAARLEKFVGMCARGERIHARD